jgi:hypothetical protein
MVGRHIGINEWPNPDCSRMTGYAEVIPVTPTATLLPADHLGATFASQPESNIRMTSSAGSAFSDE